MIVELWGEVICACTYLIILNLYSLLRTSRCQPNGLVLGSSEYVWQRISNKHVTAV